MRRSMLVFGLVAAATMLGPSAGAQETKDSPGQALPMARPGPEHEILARDEGVWEAKVELRVDPNGKPTTAKGVETITVIGDGLWQLKDFRGEFLGVPYRGHTITGYDQRKKAYVGTWVDSLASGLTTIEGTFDKKTNTLSARIEGDCPDGTAMKTRATTEHKADGTRVFTLYSPPEMGPEFAMMTITSTRRPAVANATR